MTIIMLSGSACMYAHTDMAVQESSALAQASTTDLPFNPVSNLTPLFV